MVLDASASLGDDFEKIQSYAADFARRIYDEAPNANVGVIQFSDVINKLQMTNDPKDVYEYIGNMQQGNFTTLYEAMDMGISDLENSNADGRTILTLTDGTDNNSGPSFTPSSLKNKLNDPNTTTPINSFTIGLEGNGGVDVAVLQDLAANGGVAEFPKNITQLGVVFNTFSSTISNVYNLTYLRNQQIVSPNDPLQLKFVIKARAK